MKNSGGDQKLDEILEDFEECCTLLMLPIDAVQSAKTAFQSLSDAFTLEGDGRYWLACAVYLELSEAKFKTMQMIRSKLAEGEDLESLKPNSENMRNQCWNLSLDNFLRVFNMGIWEFFQKMHFWNQLAPSQTINCIQKIQDLEQRFNITILLSQHYKRIFEKLYQSPAATSPEHEIQYRTLYEFGWLLFLIIRNELPAFNVINVITGFQLLACIMDVIYVNAIESDKKTLVKMHFKGTPASWISKDFNVKQQHQYTALEEITNLVPNLHIDGVRAMQFSLYRKAFQAICTEHRLLDNDDGFHRGLLKNDALKANLITLNRIYSKNVADINELDERLVLQFHCKSSETKSVKKPNKFDVPLLSVEQQENLFQLVNPDLPKELPAFIRKLLIEEDPHLLVNVDNALHEIRLKFFMAAKPHLFVDIIEKRFELATSLHYQLLQSIINAELTARPHKKISQLLGKRNFNENLFVCSLELVLHLHGHKEEMEFPWLLDHYGIDAYEFQKIIGIVIQHHDSRLSKSLVKHLMAIEIECLTSLMWRREGQIWHVSNKILPTYREVLSSSISCDKENNLLAGKSEIHISLRKFYKLAMQRLHNLCEYLCDVLKEESAFNVMWYIVEYSITQHGTDILQQHHLDQLIICAIYLYARIKRISLTFQRILHMYRMQNHARSGIYRRVLLPDGRISDIIEFYNRVYVPHMSTIAAKLKSSLQLSKLTTHRDSIEITNSRQVSCAENVFLTTSKRQLYSVTHCDDEQFTTMKRSRLLTESH